MAKKITWQSVYDDFKKRYPNFKKQVMHWQPYDFLTIMLYLDDGNKCIYNYTDHRIVFVKEVKES